MMLLRFLWRVLTWPYRRWKYRHIIGRYIRIDNVDHRITDVVSETTLTIQRPWEKQA